MLTGASFAVATYLVTGNVAKSLGPLGGAAANSIFMAKVGLLGSLWFSVFGVPAWVAVVGGVAGAGVGMVIAPVIGGLVEYGINQRRGLEGRFAQKLNEVRDFLLDGKRPDGRDVESVLIGALEYFEVLEKATGFLGKCAELIQSGELT